MSRKYTEQEISLLEQIVNNKGDCLNYQRYCKDCPFREKCLPTFLSSDKKISKTRRMSLALDVLTNYYVFGDDSGDELAELFKLQQ